MLQKLAINNSARDTFRSMVAAMLVKFVVCVLATFGVVWGMSTGPPDNSATVCNSISPDPASHGDPRSGNGGFVIATDLTLGGGGFYDYIQGETYIGEAPSWPLCGSLARARR